MRILGIDPGASTGWALVVDGTVKEAGVVQEEQFFKWLEDQDADIFVVENYRIRAAPMQTKRNPWANQWRDVWELRAIGAIEYHCLLHGYQIHKQEPAIKPIAYAQLGSTYTKGKRGAHMEDAAVHALYYWRRTQAKQA